MPHRHSDASRNLGLERHKKAPLRRDAKHTALRRSTRHSHSRAHVPLAVITLLGASRRPTPSASPRHELFGNTLRTPTVPSSSGRESRQPPPCPAPSSTGVAHRETLSRRRGPSAVLAAGATRIRTTIQPPTPPTTWSAPSMLHASSRARLARERALPSLLGLLQNAPALQPPAPAKMDAKSVRERAIPTKIVSLLRDRDRQHDMPEGRPQSSSSRKLRHRQARAMSALTVAPAPFPLGPERPRPHAVGIS
jgi:hypothetical protein